MTSETQSAFRVGYALKDRHALKEHLAAKGFSQEEMTEAGPDHLRRGYSGLL